MKEIEEVIFSYNEYINRVATGCQIIADLLRQDRIAEAMKGIIDFSEGANWLIGVSKLLIQDNISVKLETDKLNEFLYEINNGLEIQDYVLVADMFEYEIKVFFEENVEGIYYNQ